MQRVYLELSSELEENPINPAFLHLSAPLVSGYDPMFYLHLNGKALWKWRKLRSHSEIFDTLQHNLSRIAGYRLSRSSCSRVGIAVYSRVQYIVKILSDTTIGSKRRQATRSQYWCRIALHPDEIAQGPSDVINELKEKEKLLIQENQQLRKELEGKLLLP